MITFLSGRVNLMVLVLLGQFCIIWSLAPSSAVSRRQAFNLIGGTAAGWVATTFNNNNNNAWASNDTPEGMDVDSFLRTGMVSQPMGVSGQAGKSRPETGVIFRDGSDVARDPKSGNVLAEILLQSASDSTEKTAILTTFSSPWPLATGTVYDIECRDANTGDGAFIAVTSNVGGKSISELKDSFFTSQLFSPTGRFSFYGQPTDIKVKKSTMTNDNNMKIIDIGFSTLSQSTQTEIPRRAQVIATIPPGTTQAVMLVASASALRWKKGSDKIIESTISSFKTTLSPTSNGMKVRAKQKSYEM